MEKREGYKPPEHVKDVSISHCPPGGRGRWRRDVARVGRNETDGGDGNGQRRIKPDKGILILVKMQGSLTPF